MGGRRGRCLLNQSHTARRGERCDDGGDGGEDGVDDNAPVRLLLHSFFLVCVFLSSSLRKLSIYAITP